MKRAVTCAIVWCGSALALGAAEERFSSSVSAAEFAAAGLGKLSAEELARLDALVREYRSGALQAARREAALAAEAQKRAEAAAARAESATRAERTKAGDERNTARAGEDAGLLQRAKVLLRPGTKIEYSTLDARLVGEFSGWEPRTVFTLDNGQRWRVTGSDSYVTATEPAPKVRIVPGVLGTFWLHVDGHRQRVKVALVDDGK